MLLMSRDLDPDWSYILKSDKVKPHQGDCLLKKSISFSWEGSEVLVSMIHIDHLEVIIVPFTAEVAGPTDPFFKIKNIYEIKQ